MAVTFNGEQLLIILESGVTEVDIEVDLYKAWKLWQLDDPGGVTNRKYPPAFRTSAGDPLTGTLDLGGYFYLRNDLGWRIRPAEEDATIFFTGNLVAETTALPITVPTLGGYTVLINGLQPVTQNVDKIVQQTVTAMLESALSSYAVPGSLAEALLILRGGRLYHVLDGGDGSPNVTLDAQGLMTHGRLRIFLTAAAAAAATMGAADDADGEIASTTFDTTAAVAGKIDNMRVS